MDNRNFFTFALDSYEAPKFTEGGRNNWVNYGADNNYGAFLVDLMNTSSTHSAILTRTIDMVAGNGWEETATNEEFIKNQFGKENLNKIALKNSGDLCVYGGYSIIVVWSKDRKSIARIDYIDFSKVRIAKPLVDDKEDPERYKREQDGVQFFWYSDNWIQYRKQAYKPKLIQGFSEKYNDEPTQLMWFANYRPGDYLYPLPSYVSGVQWIQTHYQIGNFHLNSAINGFTPSMAINIKGQNPTEEEKKVIHKDILNKMSGTSNASKLFISYSENGDNAPDILPLNANNNDQRFLQLESTVTANIAIAHSISPVVVGIQTAGKLGSSSEIIEGTRLYQMTVIDTKQFSIEETYNILSEINGVGEMELLKSKELEPFVLSNEVQMTDFDELLEEIDFEDDEEEKNND